MPASQLAAACWVAYPAQADLLHWETSTFARARVAELYPGGGVIVRPMHEPCWVTRCDVCRRQFEDSADGSQHGVTRAESEASATLAGWVVTIGGLAYCPPCIPACDEADLEILAQLAGLAPIPECPMPERIQLSRAAGSRMRPGAVKVDRTTKYGNPFRVGAGGILTRAKAYAAFCWMLALRRVGCPLAGIDYPSDDEIRRDLAGRDLACWCPPPDKPGEPDICHAAELIKIANKVGS